MGFSRELSNDAWFFKQKSDKGHRAPLRTIAEMADEFGVTISALRNRLTKSTDSPPKPKVTHCNAACGSKVYYEPKELREWWSRQKN